MHFITICHCNHGKVDYKKVIRTDTSGDVDWGKPFCMLKPKLAEKAQTVEHSGRVQDTVQSHAIDSDTKMCKAKQAYKSSSKLGNKDQDSGNEAHNRLDLKLFDLLGFTKNKYMKVNNLIRKKFDLLMEKLSNGKWIEYTSKEKYHYYKKVLNNTDPQTALLWESNNLVCYKMARRKKYARRKISFFMPHSFVGALYECLLPLDSKQKIIQQLFREASGDTSNLNSCSNTDSSLESSFMIQNFQFTCDPHLSIPVAPLLADDSTKQWFENKMHHFLNPRFVQTIPYLTTSTPWNLRFSVSETSDMYRDSWASKIDVNEKYTYNEADLHLISKAVAYSANLLNKLIAPVDFNELFKNSGKTNDRQNEEPSSMNGGIANNFNLKRVLSFEQRLFVWLASSRFARVIEIMNKIERHWEGLDDQTFHQERKDSTIKI